ncbi:MAG: hypothetical protein U0936_16945 [Planctomycetaceae bacterium]
MKNIPKPQWAIQTSSPHRNEGRLSRMLQNALHWTTYTSVLIAVIGCNSQEAQHEDEHLEHFVPAHKPTDYAALVDQLETRIAQQTQSTGSGDGTPTAGQSATQRQELMDIIGWIPELAADSELQKKDFEMAVSAGAKLSLALGFETPGAGSPPADHSSIPKLLEELKALVSKSQTSAEPM